MSQQYGPDQGWAQGPFDSSQPASDYSYVGSDTSGYGGNPYTYQQPYATQQPYGSAVEPYGVIHQPYGPGYGQHPYPGGYWQPPQTSVLAILSLVLSAFSVIAIITAPVGLILGIVARNQIKREPDRYTGSGLALGGIILGAVMSGLYLLVIAAYIVLISWARSQRIY